MGARPVAVRQADIARAVRAVRSAGMSDRMRIIVENGRVVIEPKDDSPNDKVTRLAPAPEDEIVDL